MLKMDLTFEDFNNVTRQETHYFNMTRREMTLLMMKHAHLVDADTGRVEGGFVEFLEAVRARGNGEELGQVFEDIILNSYGLKSADGRRFEKSPEIRADFAMTAAYDQLFYQLMTNEEAMRNFVQSVFAGPEKDADKPSVAPAAAHGISHLQTEPAASAEKVAAPTPEQIAAYLEAQKNTQSDLKGSDLQ